MQRVVAIVLGIAVLGAAGHLSQLHTHPATDLAHAEHQHGLGAHRHDVFVPHAIFRDGGQDDDARHVDSHGPARYVISFTLGYAAAASSHSAATVSPRAAVIEPPTLIRHVHALTDVRVHGPPARRLGPSRAPPATLPA